MSVPRAAFGMLGANYHDAEKLARIQRGDVGQYLCVSGGGGGDTRIALALGREDDGRGVSG